MTTAKDLIKTCNEAAERSSARKELSPGSYVAEVGIDNVKVGKLVIGADGTADLFLHPGEIVETEVGGKLSKKWGKTMRGGEESNEYFPGGFKCGWDPTKLEKAGKLSKEDVERLVDASTYYEETSGEGVHIALYAGGTPDQEEGEIVGLGKIRTADDLEKLPEQFRWIVGPMGVV